VCLRVYVYMFVCTCVAVFVRVYVRVSACMRVLVCERLQVYVCVFIPCSICVSSTPSCLFVIVRMHESVQIFPAYGVAAVGRIDKITGLFCRISSVLHGSFAKETYNLIDPANQSHPIDVSVPSSACTRLLHAHVRNTLQHVATHCNTPQHTALRMHARVCPDTHTPPNVCMHTSSACTRLQHTATHSNILQHTATHRNTPQHTALPMHACVCPDTHAHTLTHTHIFQHSQGTHNSTNGRKHIVLTTLFALQHTTTHCNALQHTATQAFPRVGDNTLY